MPNQSLFQTTKPLGWARALNQAQQLHCSLWHRSLCQLHISLCQLHISLCQLHISLWHRTWSLNSLYQHTGMGRELHMSCTSSRIRCACYLVCPSALPESGRLCLQGAITHAWLMSCTYTSHGSVNVQEAWKLLSIQIHSELPSPIMRGGWYITLWPQLHIRDTYDAEQSEAVPPSFVRHAFEHLLIRRGIVFRFHRPRIQTLLPALGLPSLPEQEELQRIADERRQQMRAAAAASMRELAQPVALPPLPPEYGGCWPPLASQLQGTETFSHNIIIHILRPRTKVPPSTCPRDGANSTLAVIVL